MYNLVSLNINGLNDHLKQTALTDWLKCMKADIVYLQETHAASHSTIQGWFHNSGFRVASSSTSVKRCGTAILVKDLYTITQVHKDNDGRFSQVEVDLAGDKLWFVYLYARNTNPSRNAFFSSLPDFIDLAVPTFICGDFNAVLDPDLDRRRHPFYAGPSHRGTYQESVAALNLLLAATQTFPIWRTRHLRDTTFSWDHPSGSFSSRIGMIWAPMCLDQCITDCQYHTSFFFQSSLHAAEVPSWQCICTGVWKWCEVWGCGSLTPLCLTIRSIVPLLGPSGRPRRPPPLTPPLLQFLLPLWTGGTKGSFTFARSLAFSLVPVQPSVPN